MSALSYHRVGSGRSHQATPAHPLLRARERALGIRLSRRPPLAPPPQPRARRARPRQRHPGSDTVATIAHVPLSGSHAAAGAAAAAAALAATTPRWRPRNPALLSALAAAAAHAAAAAAAAASDAAGPAPLDFSDPYLSYSWFATPLLHLAIGADDTSNFRRRPPQQIFPQGDDEWTELLSIVSNAISHGSARERILAACAGDNISDLMLEDYVLAPICTALVSAGRTPALLDLLIRIQATTLRLPPQPVPPQPPPPLSCRPSWQSHRAWGAEAARRLGTCRQRPRQRARRPPRLWACRFPFCRWR